MRKRRRMLAVGLGAGALLVPAPAALADPPATPPRADAWVQVWCRAPDGSVAAYERAADRYNDQPIIAAEATYRAGLAYTKQARTAEYDQGTAGQAIATFKDFINLFPDDKRVPEAKRLIDTLKEEQARGSFQTATFYASRKKWKGAMVYYNEVLLQAPLSQYATQAREQIDGIKKRVAGTP